MVAHEHSLVCYPPTPCHLCQKAWQSWDVGPAGSELTRSKQVLNSSLQCRAAACCSESQGHKTGARACKLSSLLLTAWMGTRRRNAAAGAPLVSVPADRFRPVAAPYLRAVREDHYLPHDCLWLCLRRRGVQTARTCWCPHSWNPRSAFEMRPTRFEAILAADNSRV